MLADGHAPSYPGLLGCFRVGHLGTGLGLSGQSPKEEVIQMSHLGLSGVCVSGIPAGHFQEPHVDFFL